MMVDGYGRSQMNTTEADVRHDEFGDGQSAAEPALHDQQRDAATAEQSAEQEKAPAITTPNAIAGAPADTDPDAGAETIAGSQTRLLDSGTSNGRTSTIGRAMADEEEIVDLDLPANRYLDRELSWLAFNNRVLALAKDKVRIPLLERVRFLSIFSSNLDEFFMVRVAGLKRRIAAGVAVPSVSGLMPREIHEAILARTGELVAEQARIFAEEVRPELAEHGIEILRWDQLTSEEKDRMRQLFADRIFPVLTPLAVDPSHPFPYISGLSLNLAVIVKNPETGARQFARVKVPSLLPRFVSLSEGRFVALEDIIARHLDQLFGGMQIVDHHVFRVTRNEDVEVEEDDAENLLVALEKELLRRRVGRPPVRLEVADSMDPKMLELLRTELDVSPYEVFKLATPLDLGGLNSVADLDRAELKYPAFLPKTHPHLAEVETAKPADMFAALKQRDVLLHHPYDSFATSVQRFIEQAADDPQVLAIKQTLYRTSGDSPIVDALIEASQAGKQVLAVVEIKARFDEQANIAWARRLEQHGCHVVYGLMGLKTHCKLAMVVREEPEGLRRYAHIGTGNYNPKTARQYEDMGLLTANPIVTEDIGRLFNNLSGMSQEREYRRLLVAPHGIRTGLIERIEKEIEHQRAGRPAGIRIKINSLVDETVTDALYRASMAGVKVDLWVRGICTLRPQIQGLSDNIRVRSIVGRFLEHSRLFWFTNGGQPNVGMGSADLMHRNLDRRIEVLVSITNQAHVDEIGQLFDLAFDDRTAAWWLSGDGTWRERVVDDRGVPFRDLQEMLINRSTRRRSK
jgi:polyphosphate kinase